MTDEHETSGVTSLINSDNVLVRHHGDVLDGGGDLLSFILRGCGRLLLRLLLYRSNGLRCLLGYLVLLPFIFVVLGGHGAEPTIFLLVEKDDFFVLLYLSFRLAGSRRPLVCLRGAFQRFLVLEGILIQLVDLCNHRRGLRLCRVVRVDED